jgi:hypothetical protein
MMEQERLMVRRAATGRIFMSGLFGGGGGGGQAYTPPPPATPPAVQIAASAKGRSRAMDMRKRQARAGQTSMSAGGYSAGGSSGGQTLMGA